MILSKQKNYKIIGAALCCASLAGCATSEQNKEILGAGLGAALGAGIAALAGGNTAEILGAAAGGALAGWGVAKLVNYQSHKTRTVAEDRKIYGMTQTVSTTLVKIRRGSCSPEMVRPGGTVKIVTDYSVIAPPETKSVNIAESWVLKKDGRVLTALEPQYNQRTPGGWSANAQINIPADAAPGTYVVEHKVEAGTSYDVDQSVFVVQ